MIPSYGQNLDQKIVVKNHQKVDLDDLLNQLPEQGIPITYSLDKLPNPQLNFATEQITLKTFLDTLSRYSIVSTLISDQYILSFEVKNLSGYVLDQETGEILIGAVVFQDSTNFVVTNKYGFYALDYWDLTKPIKTQYIGYQTSSIKAAPYTQKTNISLTSEKRQLRSILVESRNIHEHVINTTPGQHRLNYEEDGKIPYFMGETDLLQEAIMLPGIRTLGEDASGINIRGGSIDQNLIMLDEATVFNPNHFYGLISVFNPEAVNQVQIMKGFIPAEYGGRASSVINIQQREGNYEKVSGAGGVGFVSARFLIEGPLIKEKASFLISARQSILDLSTDRFNRNAIQRSRASFQDLNLKTNIRANDKNNFYLSLYIGNDANRNILEESNRWGNNTATFRWNHTWNKSLFSHMSFSFSDYNYRVINPVEAASFIGTSEIRNFNIKSDNEWYTSSNGLLKFGFQSIWHQLSPGERLPFDDGNSSTNPLTLDNEEGWEYALYASYEWKPFARLGINTGIRYGGLVTFGPGKTYVFDDDQPRSAESILDTITYKGRSPIDWFDGLEPRLSMNWLLLDNSSVKLSYTRTRQYLQLISNTAIPAPTDIWKLSNRYLQPVRSDHISLGYYQDIGNQISFTAESYFKQLNQLIEYKNGADLLFNPIPETELLGAEGRSYGLEVMVEKKQGKIQGWLSYTLSRSERRVVTEFEENAVNAGEYYPDNQDKTHDLTLVTKYELNKKWLFSAALYYHTGRPITLPSGKYVINETIIPHFEGRNQDRLSDYHRLDLSARYRPGIDKNRRWKSSWNFTIYNAYSRQNTYTYFFRASDLDPNATQVLRYSVFGTIIPSITYNFKF